jgi:hypothetical protein
MAIDAVTAAIKALLEGSLGHVPGGQQMAVNVAAGAPGAAAGAHLFLFLYLITPAPELRNSDRVRPFPGPADPPRLLKPAVPLDLHFLLAVGPAAPDQGLGLLADAIRVIEGASPLIVPNAGQAAVWLSLLPMTSDEMSRIWGLVPNEICRSSVAFRAAPVWIDPLVPVSAAPPVTDDEALAGRKPEPAL